MSGFEIIGATGVAVQLIETSAKTARTIAELCQRVRNAPKMLHKGKTQLEQLAQIAQRVESNPSLQGAQTESILRSLSQDVQSLRRIFAQLTPELDAKKLVRYWKALSAARKDDEIQRFFNAIEQGKGTLSLYITSVDSRLLHDLHSHLPALLGQLAVPGSSSDTSSRAREQSFHVSLGRNERFVGRKDVLKELHARMEAGIHRMALVGLGGVGKTQVALELAYQLQEANSECSVFWVYASSKTRYQESCTSILKATGHQDSVKGGVDAAVLKDYLEHERSGKWLLIVDNADDDDVFFDSSEGCRSELPLSELLPRPSNGAILFTTRTRKLGAKLAASGLLEITATPLDESKQMLTRYLAHPPSAETEKAFSRLLESLERLPLAIVQAASYINENDVTLAEHLEDYYESDESRIYLLSSDFQDVARPKDNPNPIMRTWLLSLSRIEKTDPLAAEYLFLMSLIGRQGIPKYFLPSTTPPVKGRTSLGTLKGYSFVTERPGGRLLDMHRLVHFATRRYLEHDGRMPQIRQAVLRQLSVHIPNADYQDLSVISDLMPHVLQLSGAFSEQDSSSVGEDLLYNASHGFRSLGDLASAELFAAQDLRIKEARFGKDHRETYLSALNLADMLYVQGTDRLPRSKALLEQGLHGLESSSPDPNDIWILWSRSCLHMVRAMEDSTKAEAAELVIRQSISDSETHRPEENNMRAHMLIHLMWPLCRRERYAEAETVARKSLQLYLKETSPKHYYVQSGFSLLVSVLKHLNKIEEANQVERRMLETRVETFRRHHVNTYQSLVGLSQILRGQGEFQTAERVAREAVDGLERLLGPDDTRTTLAIDALAEALDDAGKYEEAKQHSARIVQAPRGSPDEQCYLCLFLVNARDLRHLERYEDGENAARQALEGFEANHGREHDTTISAMYELAINVREAGRYEESEKMFREALALSEMKNGKIDTLALALRLELAVNLRYQERLDEAERLLRMTVEGFEKSAHTADILCAARARSALAIVLLAAGRADEAGEAFEKAYTVFESWLGAEHRAAVECKRDYEKSKREWITDRR